MSSFPSTFSILRLLASVAVIGACGESPAGFADTRDASTGDTRSVDPDSAADDATLATDAPADADDDSDSDDVVDAVDVSDSDDVVDAVDVADSAEIGRAHV